MLKNREFRGIAMSSRTFAALLLSLFFSTFATMAAASDPPAADAHPSGPQEVRRIALIGDIPSYLERLNETVRLAKKGEFGKLSKHDKERIEVAQSLIVSILGERTDDSGLTEEKRLEVFNAQEEINAIVRADDLNRIVCTREQATGSRLPAVQECLTVGQRKARAAQARDATRDIQDRGLLGGTAQ
jgi:hypothetical protein